MHCTQIPNCVILTRYANMLCTEICGMHYAPNPNLEMWYAPDPKVLCNKINGYKLVNAHKHFIQILLVIKWDSSLSLWYQGSTTQCKDPLVVWLCLHDL